MSVGSETSVDGTAVQLVQLTDTNLLSQVDVSGNRSSSLEEPGLGLLGRKLIAGRGLDNVDVAGNLQLTLSLQELGVGVDEILSGNVSVMLVWIMCYMMVLRMGLHGHRDESRETAGAGGGVW